jgi:O-antigen/teichoic acid export membrane protein
VTLGLAVVLARYLGVEGMGQYSFVIAFVSVFVPLIDLGLDHILIREISRHKDIASEYVGAAIILKLLIFLVALPLGMLVTWLVGGPAQENWAILLCFFATLLCREIPTVVAYAVFLAYERMEFRASVTLFYQIIKFAFVLPVILLKGGLVEIFGALLIAEAGQGFLAMRHVLRRFVQPKWVFNWALWKYYVKESLPIGIAFAFNSYYFQVDILIIKYFRGAEETGLFGVPFRIITTLFTLLIPMIWVLLPHLTRAAKESIAKLDEDGRGYLKAIFVCTAGIAVYLGIEARELTVTLFGAEFERSAVILATVSPVIVLHAFLYFYDLTLTAVGRQKMVIVGSSVIFAVKLAADLIFIPKYGAMGGAIGTLAADLVCFIVMYQLTRKYVTSFNLFSIMVAPVTAVLAAGFILWLIRSWPIYITAVIFGFVYVLFVWSFKVISEDQKIFMRKKARQWLQKLGLLRK